MAAPRHGRNAKTHRPNGPMVILCAASHGGTTLGQLAFVLLGTVVKDQAGFAHPILATVHQAFAHTDAGVRDGHVTLLGL